MDTTFIPTPQDAALKNEASITKSASFAGTTFDWGSGFAPGGIGLPMATVVGIESIAGTGTLTLTPMDSADNTTYSPSGPTVIIAANGSTPQLTPTGQLSVPSFQSQRYSRGSLTLSGSGTFTLSSYLHPLTPLL